MNSTEDTKTDRRGSGSNDQLGPLPEASTRTDWHIDGYGEPAFTEDDMRAYASQEVAAERERIALTLRGMDCAHLCGIGEELAELVRRA